MNQKLKYLAVFIAGAITMYIGLYVWVFIEAINAFHKMNSGM